MATGLLAAAVYKHYTRFPCIIQNNPLIFSRKPDPKAQSKVSNPDAGKVSECFLYLVNLLYDEFSGTHVFSLPFTALGHA